MQESIVKAFPKAPISIAIVWVDMLPWDGMASAQKTARILSEDPRIRHFHDPERRVGEALAKGFNWSACAWDIYLFYPKGVEWKGAPPAPSAYVHQMGSHARDGHFYVGEDLVRELQKLMGTLVAPAPPARKGAAPPAERRN